jgi:hypothetical protein
MLSDARRAHAELSLFGGPLHQLGLRLGLVRGKTNTVLIGLVLGPALWLAIAALSLMDGVEARLSDMSLAAGHARLLVAIPLFFVAESWVGPHMTVFVATLARTGVIPPAAQAALDAEVSRINRWANWWWPEAVWLLVAVVMAATGSTLQTYGVSAADDPSRTALAWFVYIHVGLTVFRFLLFRWGWRLALWSWFLWRVSRLDLQLIPGHSDRAGGLGLLGEVHERFTPLVAALSVLECASLAESISAGELSATAVYPTVALLLLVYGVLFLAPLLVFTDKLWASRTKGFIAYTILSARYVRAFETKWTDGSTPEGEPLLGSADLQSLADLTNTVSVVKSMRWITVGPRLLLMMALASVAPLTPLLLFQYPLAELTQRFFSRMVGF